MIHLSFYWMISFLINAGIDGWVRVYCRYYLHIPSPSHHIPSPGISSRITTVIPVDSFISLFVLSVLLFNIHIYASHIYPYQHHITYNHHTTTSTHQINYNWLMSRSQFQSRLCILRHAWLNLWDERIITGRINQITFFFFLFYYKHITLLQMLTYSFYFYSLSHCGWVYVCI